MQNPPRKPTLKITAKAIIAQATVEKRSFPCAEVVDGLVGEVRCLMKGLCMEYRIKVVRESYSMLCLRRRT